MVNVPVGMDNNAQNFSNLLGALLLAHIMLSQHHTVHVSWPVQSVSFITFIVSLIVYISAPLDLICITLHKHTSCLI